MSVPDELGEQVQARARTEERGLSNMVALLLRAGLNAAEHGVIVTGAATVTGGKVFKGPDPK